MVFANTIYYFFILDTSLEVLFKLPELGESLADNKVGRSFHTGTATTHAEFE